MGVSLTSDTRSQFLDLFTSFDFGFCWRSETSNLKTITVQSCSGAIEKVVATVTGWLICIISEFYHKQTIDSIESSKLNVLINPSTGLQQGSKGREKVEKMYMKQTHIQENCGSGYTNHPISYVSPCLFSGVFAIQKFTHSFVWNLYSENLCY